MSDDRTGEVQDALSDVLENGDRFVVSKHDGTIAVVVAPSKLKEEQPQLYGTLLSLNQALVDAGGLLTIFFLVGAAGISVALHVHLLDTLIGPRAEDLRSVWLYLFLLVAAFVVGGQIATMIERSTFNNAREEVLAEIENAKLERMTVLTLIEGDPALSNVAEHLRRG